VELDTQGWIHCPTSRCQGVKTVNYELVSPRLVWVTQDVAMLQLEGVPLRDGSTFFSINGLLLILVETNQGVARNLLVHINMVLSAQTFWAEWMDNQAYSATHACHGALPSVEEGIMWPSMWPDNQPPCMPHFAHGEFEF